MKRLREKTKPINRTAEFAVKQSREGEAPAEPMNERAMPTALCGGASVGIENRIMLRPNDGPCPQTARQEPRPPRHRSSRLAFTLLEMIVAMLLLGTTMAIVVPVLGWMGIENRLSLQRQEAVQGLNNLMDELTSRSYAELTPEAAGKIELSNALKRQLPGAKLTVEITETMPEAKRIHMQLSWNQKNGKRLSPVRLTAWVHPRRDQP